MPNEPKKRHSRQRQGKRRAAIYLATPAGTSCNNCGKPIRPHAICQYCGYYRGKEIIAKKSKTSQKEEGTQTAAQE